MLVINFHAFSNETTVIMRPWGPQRFARGRAGVGGPPATSIMQLLVASLQNSCAVILGVHLGEKKVSGLRMLRITNVQKSVQSMGENLLLFRKVQIEREDGVSWKKETSQNCSTAALNSGWMGLEGAEDINLLCPVAQGYGEWKNEHVMYRLDQCCKCVWVTTAT